MNYLNNKEQEEEKGILSIINKIDVNVKLRKGSKFILLKDINNKIDIKDYDDEIVDIIIDNEIVGYGKLSENNNKYEVKIISINEDKD
jgi:flagellar motor switch/type III secretory pathway protein FliN